MGTVANLRAVLTADTGQFVDELTRSEKKLVKFSNAIISRFGGGFKFIKALPTKLGLAVGVSIGAFKLLDKALQSYVKWTNNGSEATSTLTNEMMRLIPVYGTWLKLKDRESEIQEQIDKNTKRRDEIISARNKYTEHIEASRREAFIETLSEREQQIERLKDKENKEIKELAELWAKANRPVEELTQLKLEISNHYIAARQKLRNQWALEDEQINKAMKKEREKKELADKLEKDAVKKKYLEQDLAAQAEENENRLRMMTEKRIQQMEQLKAIEEEAFNSQKDELDIINEKLSAYLDAVREGKRTWDDYFDVEEALMEQYFSKHPITVTGKETAPQAIQGIMRWGGVQVVENELKTANKILNKIENNTRKKGLGT